MTRYAAKTEVSVSQSESEIKAILRRYGADRMAFAEEPGTAKVVFQMQGRQVRFLLPLPDARDDEFRTYMRGSVKFERESSAATKLYEQACRQRWRALLLVIKAKLEAVETGITTFEDEFLAHTVLPDGRTVGEWSKPQVEQAYLTGNMPKALMLEAPSS